LARVDIDERGDYQPDYMPHGSARHAASHEGKTHSVAVIGVPQRDKGHKALCPLSQMSRSVKAGEAIVGTNNWLAKIIVITMISEEKVGTLGARGTEEAKS
jgi:hypothetical protein